MKKETDLNILKVMIRYPLEVCLVLLLSFLILFVFEQVVSRYIFRHIEIWAAELQQGLFIWCSLIACIIAVKEEGHYRATYFIDKLSPLGKKVLLLVNNLLIGFTLIILFWYGIDSTKIAGMQNYVGLPFSRMAQYISLPICAVPMFLYLLVNIWTNLKEIVARLSNKNYPLE
jgi:TRAP-type C4-dicarboxylate transport system permease small subunit